jgi:hypothetical protein
MRARFWQYVYKQGISIITSTSMQYAKQKQKQIVLEGAVTGYRTMIAETENQFDMQDPS